MRLTYFQFSIPELVTFLQPGEKSKGKCLVPMEHGLHVTFLDFGIHGLKEVLYLPGGVEHGLKNKTPCV